MFRLSIISLCYVYAFSHCILFLSTAALFEQKFHRASSGKAKQLLKYEHSIKLKPV